MNIHELETMEDVLHLAVVRLKEILGLTNGVAIDKKFVAEIGEILHLICACIEINPLVLGDELSANLCVALLQIREEKVGVTLYIRWTAEKLVITERRVHALILKVYME